MDVRTSFDSTVLIFESVELNKAILRKIQDSGCMDFTCWPLAFHILPHTGVLMQNSLTFVRPIREATLELF